MTKYVVLDPNEHNDLKILPHTNFKQSAKHHILPLSINEFAQASSNFPVVYMKDAQQGKFRSISMLGLSPEKNLFFTEDEWLATYVPDSILRAPFELGPDLTVDKTLTLYIDQESDYISKTDGEALFNDNEPSQFLLSVQQTIATYYQNESLTYQFTELLLKYNLLTEIELVTQFQDNEQNKIKGLYIINEVALKALPHDVVVELHQRNFFMPIYAMLASLSQVNRLVMLNNKYQERKIAGIKMRNVVEDEL